MFTKKINATNFEIINTQKVEVDKNQVDLKQNIEVMKENDSAKTGSDLKDLFFKSESESDAETDDEKTSNHEDKVVTNVFGLKQGHPGSFINPYKRFTNNVSSQRISLKVPNSEIMNVSSSDESEDPEDINQKSAVLSQPSEDDVSIEPNESIKCIEVIPAAKSDKLSDEKEFGVEAGVLLPSNNNEDAPMFGNSEIAVEEESLLSIDDTRNTTGRISKSEMINKKSDEFIKKLDSMTNPSDLVLLTDATEKELDIMRLKQKKNMAVSETVSDGK